MELKNWAVTSNDNGYNATELLKFYMCGNVYGSTSFEDGTPIATSRIVDMEDHDDYKVVITRSGSRYILKADEVDKGYEAMYPNAYNRLSMK